MLHRKLESEGLRKWRPPKLRNNNKRFLLLTLSMLCAFQTRVDAGQFDEKAIEAAVNDLIIAPILEIIKKGDGELHLELVIIENEALRGKLAQHYKSFDSVVLFVARDDVVYDNKEDVNRYRASMRSAHVNVFRVLQEADGVLDVTWSRSHSSLSASQKEIKMVIIMGRWSVVRVEKIWIS